MKCSDCQENEATLQCPVCREIYCNKCAGLHSKQMTGYVNNIQFKELECAKQ